MIPEMPKVWSGVIRQLCQAFLRRELAQGGYGMGKKREAAVESFFVGAANAMLIVTKGDKSWTRDYENLLIWMSVVLSVRGYSAVLEAVESLDPELLKERATDGKN